MSLVFVIIGLAFPSHSEQALIGFFFLFLLSFVLITDNLEYKVGVGEVYVYGNNFSSYHWDYANPPPTNPSTEMVLFHVNKTDNYRNYDSGQGIRGLTTHNVGFWMAIGSAFGFMSVFLSLRGGWRKDD